MASRARLRVTAAAACAAATVVAAGAAPAGADSANWHRTLTSEVIAPFQLAVGQNGVYLTDGFTGTVARATRSGLTPVAQAPGAAGVDVTSDGKSLAYAWSNDDHTQTGLTITRSGRPDVVADLAGYEASANPDGGTTYGIVAGGNPCATAIFEELTQGPATYTGITDSHPYSVASSSSGWYVADAGMNAVVRVSGSGAVSTVAVLPPQPITLTQDMVDAVAEEEGAPAGALDCLVGVTYAFEAVPTDVEVDQSGMLYVSVLPGGPESPALGARGKVYKVDPMTGATSVVADGLLGATNIAVASDGTLYATQLFGGEVSRIRGGHVSTVAHLAMPLSVEVHGGYLYVGTFAEIDFATFEVVSPGTVVRLKR